MRFTIERIRTLVLAAGVLLIVAIAAFLGMDRWRHFLAHPDIPKHLGVNIQQEANGVTYTQAHGGHTLFKIHASRVVELKNDHATLHDVVIELYGRTGASVDRIQGAEFDYDNKTGIATAAGPVEITLEQGFAEGGKRPAAASKAGRNLIHVKTSGLVFNQQTGMVTTAQRVEFATAEASGSALGASYDSVRDLLVLDREVALTAHPAPARGRTPAPVELHAEHAEFDRDAQICYLTDARASTSAEDATAAKAQVAVRGDGSVEKLDATGGFTLTSATGSHLAAPTATMEFDAKNQPVRGRLAGGVKLHSASDGRTVSGSSEIMDLGFDGKGRLRHAHMDGGVELASKETDEAEPSGGMDPEARTRTWRSPVADVEFRPGERGRLEPAEIRGNGGVVVTSQTRRGNGPAVSSRLAADALSGRFGPQATLRSMSGTGHASVEQTAANGAHQVATGDTLQARFAPPAEKGDAGVMHGAVPSEDAAQIESAVLEGHVTLRDQPAQKPGHAQEAPLVASAERAEYQSAGQRLHLTGNPHVQEGGMDVSADILDVAQASGAALARGNVKATWNQVAQDAAAPLVSLGGRGPVHAIADEAVFHQASGEASFRGRARVWQQDNFISGPLIVLDRQKQTLVARTTQASDPVTVVILSAPGPQSASGVRSAREGHGSRAAAPAVVRVRGGDLWYSGGERKAILRAAPLAAVTAQSGAVESTSNRVELYLAPSGAASDAAGAGVPAQVERMVASGKVVLSAQGRHGTGEQLAYASRTGEYVLTGTATSPPRLTDPQRGSVTGSALIFNSRNDSVSIEGHGQETMTETAVPR